MGITFGVKGFLRSLRRSQEAAFSTPVPQGGFKDFKEFKEFKESPRGSLLHSSPAWGGICITLCKRSAAYGREHAPLHPKPRTGRHLHNRMQA